MGDVDREDHRLFGDLDRVFDREEEGLLLRPLPRRPRRRLLPDAPPRYSVTAPPGFVTSAHTSP